MIAQCCISTYNRPEMLCKAIKSIIAQGIFDIDIIIHLNTAEGSTVKVCNHFKSDFEYDVQFGICDDMEMQEGCLKSAFECFNKNFPDLDGLVGFNQVNIPDGCQVAACMVGRKFAERFPNRIVYCPEYHHFGVDVECLEYAKSVNKYVYCPEAKVYHHHPAHSDYKQDGTYKLLRKFAVNDHSIQAERKAKGLVWGKNFHLIAN